MNSREKLSALIITYNEIDHIAACIRSIDFADEIIVVDSYSTDGTWQFLKNHPKIHALQRPFEHFTAQKSFALTQATHPWVLFVDADERVPPNLQQEILTTIQTPHSCDAYYVYRQFMIENKPLKFSGLQTDKVYRLFRKVAVTFDPQKLVHEDLIVQGTTGKLTHKLLHYFYKDYATYKSKMLWYGKLRGFEVYKKGIIPNAFYLYIKPLYKFLNHYLIRLGFLDGRRGYIISYLNALSVYERYREVQRLRKENSRSFS